MTQHLQKKNNFTTRIVTWVSVVCVVVLVCMPVTPALAVTDQFIISQNVSSVDAIAPSVPLNVFATGVSMTEIDIDWDNSTDDVAVAGYQVFRDGMQIATTVVSNFSDTGLTPATAYDYTIVAFDAAGNFSTSSATSTGTTNAIPSVIPSVGGNAVKPVVPLLSQFKIVVTESSAHLSWRTSIPTRTMVSWGTTQDYEMGSLSESIHLSAHATLIPNLAPGTVYRYQILARDKSGNETILKEESFTTTSLPDTEAPPNVGAFTGRIEGADAVLSWTNPRVADFAQVRVVRKDAGYPRDPFDGVLVYEGNGESFRDLGAFKNDGVRHYAIFAYDEKGNDASGAVVRLEKKRGVVSYEPKQDDVVVDLGTGTSSPFQFSDLIFEQGGTVVSFLGDDVPLDAQKSFTIKIPYGRLPEHLKTILVSFMHPSDRALTFSFLLRVNDAKTFYEATVDSLGESGKYGLALSVLDMEEQTISKVVGTLEVQEVRVFPPTQNTTQSFWGFLLNALSVRELIMGIIMLFLVLIVLYMLAKYRRGGNGPVTNG